MFLPGTLNHFPLSGFGHTAQQEPQNSVTFHNTGLSEAGDLSFPKSSWLQAFVYYSSQLKK